MTTLSPSPGGAATPSLSATDAMSFIPRHIGPSAADVEAMLALLGYDTLDALIDATVPDGIRLKRPLAIHAPMSEHEALVEPARRSRSEIRSRDRISASATTTASRRP